VEFGAFRIEARSGWPPSSFAESAIFHDFRRGVSLLHGEEPDRADAARSAGNSHLLHDLSSVQQPHNPLSRESFLERGKRGAFLTLWLLTIVLGGLFMYGTGHEWHRLIYEHGADNFHQPFLARHTTRSSAYHAFHVTVGLPHAGHRA